MRTFKVLEAHLGDKEYKPGDTRELEPNDAKTLVDLKVLEPADGGTASTDTEETVSIPQSRMDELKARFETLTNEREQALTDLDSARRDAADVAKDLDAARQDLAKLTDERDSARRDTQAAEGARDTALARVAELEAAGAAKPNNKAAR